jgi:hypothetical protein
MNKFEPFIYVLMWGGIMLAIGYVIGRLCN